MYSTHIKLCGYDYYQLSKTIAGGKKKLALRLAKDAFILSNFKK
jgi:hypothetical protein